MFAIFVLRFKNEAYSVNILILANAANVSNDSTKVAVYFILAFAAVSNDSMNGSQFTCQRFQR